MPTSGRPLTAVAISATPQRASPRLVGAIVAAGFVLGVAVLIAEA
jgi:hypothetical protein